MHCSRTAASPLRTSAQAFSHQDNLCTGETTLKHFLTLRKAATATLMPCSESLLRSLSPSRSFSSAATAAAAAASSFAVSAMSFGFSAGNLPLSASCSEGSGAFDRARACCRAASKPRKDSNSRLSKSRLANTTRCQKHDRTFLFSAAGLPLRACQSSPRQAFTSPGRRRSSSSSVAGRIRHSSKQSVERRSERSCQSFAVFR
mmetsp:Transcript_75351/g.133007  ORF Transcript_75351/g.133007 Transcript_75351/m.133007 type:complete len:203 (-) Transcript_75351:86-694(-)